MMQLIKKEQKVICNRFVNVKYVTSLNILLTFLCQKTRDLVLGTANQLDLIAYEKKKEKETEFCAISNTCWNWKHTLKKCV